MPSIATINDVIQVLEKKVPLSLQEPYDNSGLIVGDSKAKIQGVLLSIDCTEAVVKEAIKKKCNLIISHHPILFRPIKKLVGSTYVERTIMLAIQNKISIYAIHTNLDSTTEGVSHKMGQKLGLEGMRILRPNSATLRKLVTFCPLNAVDRVRNAIFEAGAGKIGAYDRCSFNVEGQGTFRGDETTNPYVGKVGKDHVEEEIRIETIFHYFNQPAILKALFDSHPYEEVAYDIYTLNNTDTNYGMGIIGSLKKEMKTAVFLKKVKETFMAQHIRHTELVKNSIKTVAFCGGSGSFVLSDAIRQKADILITADVKYHEFFDADGQIILADIGHFESEQFTTEIIAAHLKEFFSTFAVHFSRVITNPINYF